MKENNRLYTIVLVVLLTFSAYLLADTVDAVIGRSLDAAPKFTGPVAQERTGIEPKRELSSYSSILDRGLFGEGRTPTGAAAAGPASIYVLIGTAEGTSFAGAVLQDAAGLQTFYRMHEKLPDGSQIIKVQRDRITFRREDGGTVDLQLSDDTKIVNVASRQSPAAGIKKLAEGRYAVDEREVASSTENMNQLLTQARAVPFMEQGKTVGFRISEIVPGSLYDKIGLTNGDVIQRVNSQEVDDPGKFFQMYQGLKDEKRITVDLLRNGQRQSLSYDIQ